MAGLLQTLARESDRPRYAFMVLNLIAQVARRDGQAGPIVSTNGQGQLLRDWLCEALMPMGARTPGRRALAARVRSELKDANALPEDEAEAVKRVDQEVCERMRATGKTAVSRAVTQLVGAGLLHRHYQGVRVDHVNRGAQRHAVYTLTPAVFQLLRSSGAPVSAAPRQPELPW